MTQRFMLPGVLDVVLVSEPAHVSWLNNHPLVTRRLNPATGILQRLLNRRTSIDMRFSKGVLPVFRLRGATERAGRKATLQSRLDALPIEQSQELATLVGYVEGRSTGTTLGVRDGADQLDTTSPVAGDVTSGFVEAFGFEDRSLTIFETVG